MLPEERRKRIVQLVEETGSASVNDLSSLMDVSPMTIRRDITHLASRGLLVKAHGGAISPRMGTSAEPFYEVKAKVNVKEKQRIGAAAAEIISDGEVVLLDSGSTTYQIARNLRNRRSLTVVTNDLLIASYLSKIPAISVIQIGGSIRYGIFSTVGTYAEEMLSQLSVDKVFLGADAVNLEKGVLNSNPDEVPVKRLMIKSGREVILVTDNSKFCKLGLAFVCEIDDIVVILTDDQVDADVVSHLEERGVTVKIA